MPTFASAPITTATPQELRSRQKKMSSQFPSILREMLERADTDGHASVVSWLPHGRAFKIHDEEKFMAEVAPLFFRATKMRSFHRQLYFWSFQRVTTGVDRDAWFHECFVRDSPMDMLRMVRTKIKGVKDNNTVAHIPIFLPTKMPQTAPTQQQLRRVTPPPIREASVRTILAKSASLRGIMSSPADEDFESFLSRIEEGDETAQELCHVISDCHDEGNAEDPVDTGVHSVSIGSDCGQESAPARTAGKKQDSFAMLIEQTIQEPL